MLKLKRNPIGSFFLILFMLVGCNPPATSPVPTPSPASTLSQTQTATSAPIPTSTLTPTPILQPAMTFTATYSVSPDSLFLSDMQPYINPENIYGGLALDKVFWQPEIWIDGTYYAKGLGMHPPSVGTAFVGYRVTKGYTSFAALAGLAWQDENPGCETVGDARFRVYLNNELEFDSGVVHFGPPLVIDIAVNEGDVVRLEVDYGEDDYECDHATWAEARFEP
jgi:hypothetical protein